VSVRCRVVMMIWILTAAKSTWTEMRIDCCEFLEDIMLPW
jgi:hypothetical protein